MKKNWERKQQQLLENIRKKTSERTVQLAESNYGRAYGWWVELNGKVIAELQHCHFEDMFWDSYKVVACQAGFEEKILDKDFWFQPDIKFRNKGLNEYCDPLIGLGQENLAVTSRLWVRGLYFSSEDGGRALLQQYGELLRRIPDEEKPVTNTQFSKIYLRKALKQSNKIYYIIEINPSGYFRVNTIFKNKDYTSESIVLKPKELKKLQGLMDEIKLFEQKPSSLNRYKITELLYSKLLRRDIMHLTVVNEGQERSLTFRTIEGAILPEQSIVVNFIKKIEQLVKDKFPAITLQ